MYLANAYKDKDEETNWERNSKFLIYGLGPHESIFIWICSTNFGHRFSINFGIYFTMLN